MTGITEVRVAAVRDLDVYAYLASLPVDEIIAVADTVLVRPDPEPVTA